VKQELDPRTLRAVARRMRRFAQMGINPDRVTKAVNNTVTNWVIELEFEARQIVLKRMRQARAIEGKKR
jgi:hypothetical protein